MYWRLISPNTPAKHRQALLTPSWLRNTQHCCLTTPSRSPVPLPSLSSQLALTHYFPVWCTTPGHGASIGAPWCWAGPCSQRSPWCWEAGSSTCLEPWIKLLEARRLYQLDDIGSKQIQMNRELKMKTYEDVERCIPIVHSCATWGPIFENSSCIWCSFFGDLLMIFWSIMINRSLSQLAKRCQARPSRIFDSTVDHREHWPWFVTPNCSRRTRAATDVWDTWQIYVDFCTWILLGCTRCSVIACHSLLVLLH